jgi:hypothetical protein
MPSGYLYNGFCYSDTLKLKLAVSSYKTTDIHLISQTPLRFGKVLHRIALDVTPYDGYATVLIKSQYITFDQNNNISSSSYLDHIDTVYFCDFPNKPVEAMNITLQNPPDNFNPSNLNPVDVFNSIGSGFLLVAVPLAVVWAGRHFLRPLFSK